MTEAEAEALGKRLVACKGFRPLRGMLDMQGRSWGADLLFRWSNDVDVPDLRDPATLGCVLALVREAWCKPLAFAFSEDEGMWEIGVVRRYYDHFVDTLRTGGSWGYTEGQAEVVYEPSEAHVLVRAMEVADALHATKETP